MQPGYAVPLLTALYHYACSKPVLADPVHVRPDSGPTIEDEPFPDPGPDLTGQNLPAGLFIIRRNI
jgi:hypothetical protein